MPSPLLQPRPWLALACLLLTAALSPPSSAQTPKAEPPPEETKTEAAKPAPIEPIAITDLAARSEREQAGSQGGSR